MATYTDNYHLSKPETTDSQQSFMEDYATNMDIIDENMGGGSGGGGHVIIDENDTEVAQEPNMQFTGKVEVTDDSTNEKTVVEVLPEVIEVTLAEYIALGDAVNTDGKLYCITDLNNSDVQGYPPLIYSTEEREVGVWIDGKPLYQRTWEFNSNFNIPYFAWIDTPILKGDMEYIISAEFANVINNVWSDVSTALTSSQYVQALNSLNATIVVRQITLRYTKTTDVAGSGIWNGQGGLAHHYSTNETVVGTWIDEKPIYEKTFTNVANGTQILTGVSTVVDYRVSAHGTSPNSSYHCIGDGFTINSSKIFTLVDGVVTYGSWTSAAGEIEKDADFIVIQYTKTTD